MILLVLYGDGIEEAYDVATHTKLRESITDDFFYFTTLEGGQVAIASSAVEKISLGNVALTVERGQAHGTPDP